MNRKTILSGLIFVGLILATVVLLRTPEKGTRSADGPLRPIPKINPGDIDTLEVSKGDVTTTIKKDGDKYLIVKPISYPAEKDFGKNAFEALEKVEFGSVVSEKKDRHEELEVGPKGVRVIAKKGDQVVADLRIGKASGASTMVRPEGKDEVWLASGLPRYVFDKDTNGWRDKTILGFDEKDAEKLSVLAKDGGKIALVKPAPTDAGAAGDWRIVESTVKAEPMDKSIASGMVSALYNLKASDYVDAPKPEETGLDTPELTITVGLKNGEQRTLLVGKKKGEDEYYVRSAAKPQVFLAKKWGMDRILRRPIEFRDKMACDLTAEELTEIAVTHDKDSFTLIKSGADWKFAKPAGATLDTSKVGNITAAFREWKGVSFAEDTAPKVTGLAKPKATVSAKSNIKGHSCQLKIGGETTDKNNYYVQSPTLPQPVLMAKWSVDRVLPKLDDLKKK